MTSRHPPADLRELENTGLIRQLSEDPEPEFQFRHTMIQEAAYAMLTRVQRRLLHRQVGEILVALYPERVDEFADILARHFAAAGEIRAAVEYSRRAARRAASTFAYDEACAHLEGALELVREAGEASTRRQLQEELGDLYRLCRLGGKAIASFQGALADWQGDAHPPAATILALHRKILQTVADIKWAVEQAEFLAAKQLGETSRLALRQGLEQSRTAGPDLETARNLVVLSIDSWRTLVPPNWEDALSFAEEAFGIGEQFGDRVEMSSSLGALAQAHFGQGQLREHLQAALRRREITEDPAFEDPREKLDSLREVGLAHLALGDYLRALPYLDRAEEMAAEISAIDQEFNAVTLKAQCYLRLDRWDEVLTAEDRWRELARGFTREQTGPTCFAVALSACVRALRGERGVAESLRSESYDTMMVVTGGDWEANQYY